MSETEAIVAAPASTTIVFPALPEVAAPEGAAESPNDDEIKWDVEAAWEDLMELSRRLQYEVTYRGGGAHPEEAADADQVVDIEDSQSSGTLDYVDSNDTSYHSAYWSDPSASSSDDSEDAEDREGSDKSDEEQGHGDFPQDPNGEIGDGGPLEYGEIPFEDLIKPEKYSNEFFELKESGLGGIGAFAKRDLKLGEVILVERPTIKATPWDYYEKLDGLAPELRAAIGRMHGHRRSYDQDYPMAIFMTNSFGVKGGSCIYLIAARFNHACGPVKSVDFRIAYDDVIKLTMSKDVPAGTELTISYGPISPTGLYSMWGFRCKCGGCRSITDKEVEKLDRAFEEGRVW
ncbi:hypothetical protein Hte_012130 [Hypoxylon texense]